MIVCESSTSLLVVTTGSQRVDLLLRSSADLRLLGQDQARRVGAQKQGHTVERHQAGRIVALAATQGCEILEVVPEPLLDLGSIHPSSMPAPNALEARMSMARSLHSRALISARAVDCQRHAALNHVAQHWPRSGHPALA